MDSKKRKQLEKNGYKITDTQEFLGLSDAEMEIIDLKIKIGKEVRALRKELKITQKELAKSIESDQSRIAKLESGHTSVSLELQYKAWRELGATTKDIGRTISSKKSLAVA